MGLRLIQVGLGGWGRDWQAEALGTVPGVECVAVVDVSPASLDLARSRLGLAPHAGFASLDAALAAVPADAVLITAPVTAHLPLATEALKAGLDVLVEKPFGPTVAEAAEVVDLAEQLGRTLAVSQNYRYYPAAQTMQRLLAEGELGPVGTVRVDFRKWANNREPGHRHFRLRHPLLFDMAVHHFDLMRMLLGQEPVEVYARASDPPWSNFEDVAAASLLFGFPDSQTVSYRGSWVSSGAPTPWSGHWHIECEEGEFAWSGPDRLSAPDGASDGDDVLRARRHAGGDGEPPEQPDLDRGGYRSLPLDPVHHRGRAGALAAFAEAIRSGVEPAISGRHNLGTLAICEAAARSLDSGRVEPIESPSPMAVGA